MVDQVCWVHVIAFVERPGDEIDEDHSTAVKSWTVADVEAFRDSVRDERLYACWLLAATGCDAAKCWAAVGGVDRDSGCQCAAAESR